MDNAFYSIKQEYTDSDSPSLFIKREEEDPLRLPHQNQFPAQVNPSSWTKNVYLEYLSKSLKTEPGLLDADSVRKPFRILKESQTKASSDDLEFSIKFEETEAESPVSKKVIKKVKQSSSHKNYIGLICCGFARTVLLAEKESELNVFMQKVLEESRESHAVLKDLNVEELVDMFKKYIYKRMCGKRVKKSDKERDYKIRKAEELSNLLIVKKNDKEFTGLKKEVLKEMIKFFFESGCYEKWLADGMMNDSNRNFFLKNKEEIFKKFKDPLYYRPHFSHT
jgi:hypothetical protein